MGRQALISGHVRTHHRDGTLYAVLSLPQPGGGTKPKWIPTGLKDVRGNKKQADAILQQLRQEYTEKLENQCKPGSNMLLRLSL